MADSSILIANERYKAVAGGFMQLGAALLAAGIAVLYYHPDQPLEPIGWIVVASGLIWSGWMFLSLLQVES